jgi:hypothetical protein
MAGAQQSSDQLDQKPVITEPAEYADYMTAINTVDASARQAALDDFVRRYPNSVVRDQIAYSIAITTQDPEARLAALNDFLRQYPDSPLRENAEEAYMGSLIFLDRQRTAPLRQQLRQTSEKTGSIAWERACRLASEKAPETLGFDDWKFILQFRNAGPDCNYASAEKIWQQIQRMQRPAKGTPFRIRLFPVLVITSNPKYFYAAFTNDSKQAREPELRIELKDPMAKLPAPGEMIGISGFLSDYSESPFLFIMNRAEVLPANGRTPAKVPVQQRVYSGR